MVVLESPTPDVASAAVGLLDPSGPQIPLSVDTSTATGSAITLDDSPTGRGSSSMKMVPKRYTNLHNWLSLGPVSAKQLKEAVVSCFCTIYTLSQCLFSIPYHARSSALGYRCVHNKQQTLSACVPAFTSRKSSRLRKPDTLPRIVRVHGRKSFFFFPLFD